MKDITDVVKNISEIYDSDVAFTVLKDFERVIDELDVYVFKNVKLQNNLYIYYIRCCYRMLSACFNNYIIIC